MWEFAVRSSRPPARPCPHSGAEHAHLDDDVTATLYPFRNVAAREEELVLILVSKSQLASLTDTLPPRLSLQSTCRADRPRRGRTAPASPRPRRPPSPAPRLPPPTPTRTCLRPPPPRPPAPSPTSSASPSPSASSPPTTPPRSPPRPPLPPGPARKEADVIGELRPRVGRDGGVAALRRAPRRSPRGVEPPARAASAL